MNASGKAPSGQTLARMNGLGYAWDAAELGPGLGHARGGILTVTVPGSVWGWDAVLQRFGTMTFKETLQPAIDYAEQGFPISERIANDWRLPRRSRPRRATPRKCCTQLDPDSVATWYINGRPPTRPDPSQSGPGPDLSPAPAAGPRRLLQGRDRARDRGQVHRRVGGTMTLDDLASLQRASGSRPATHELSRLRRLHAAAAGADLGHRRDPQHPGGLRAACGHPARRSPRSAPPIRKYWHLVVEAKKLAFRDLYQFNADPNFAPVPLERLLSKSHATSLCGRVNPDRAAATAPGGNADSGGDTIVLSTADRAATWWRGSTACIRASARVSPCPATASPCTTGAGCSRSTRRART